MGTCFKVISVVLLMSARLDFAQAPVSHGKATELVIVKYEKLIASGAMLTPEGWVRSTQIFYQSVPYPQSSEIVLCSTGGSVGEMWVKENRAEVDTKWTDELGTIDQNLRYKPSAHPEVVMTSFAFYLIFTNEHRDIGSDGETIKKVTGAQEWKIEGPQKKRWATVDRAISYVDKMRDESNSPVIKRNAEKTIKILRRLSSRCGSASAC